MIIQMEQIGTIYTPFKELHNMPVQPYGAKETLATIQLKDKYAQGLQDLESFSHIYLFYYFHKTQKYELNAIPFNDKTNTSRGIFSTRTPLHPNNIGMSLVQLVEVTHNQVIVKGIDVLNETPLLDIKPYIENFDIIDTPVKNGWANISKEEIFHKRSDSRFIF